MDVFDAVIFNGELLCQRHRNKSVITCGRWKTRIPQLSLLCERNCGDEACTIAKTLNPYSESRILRLSGKRLPCFATVNFGTDMIGKNVKKDFKSHQEFWVPKIERNMERDSEVTAKLEAEGWTVLRFWGKEIKKNVSACADMIQKAWEYSKWADMHPMNIWRVRSGYPKRSRRDLTGNLLNIFVLLPTKSTTAKQNGHFNEYETLKSWLERERTTDSIVSLCETVYADERGRLTVRGASRRCPSMIGSTSGTRTIPSPPSDHWHSKTTKTEYTITSSPTLVKYLWTDWHRTICNNSTHGWNATEENGWWNETAQDSPTAWRERAIPPAERRWKRRWWKDSSKSIPPSAVRYRQRKQRRCRCCARTSWRNSLPKQKKQISMNCSSWNSARECAEGKSWDCNGKTSISKRENCTSSVRRVQWKDSLKYPYWKQKAPSAPSYCHRRW